MSSPTIMRRPLRRARNAPAAATLRERDRAYREYCRKLEQRRPEALAKLTHVPAHQGDNDAAAQAIDHVRQELNPGRQRRGATPNPKEKPRC